MNKYQTLDCWQREFAWTKWERLHSWKRWYTSSGPGQGSAGDGIRSRWRHLSRWSLLSGSSLLSPPSPGRHMRRHKSPQDWLCPGPSVLNRELEELYYISSLFPTEPEYVNPAAKLVSFFRHCIDVTFPNIVQSEASVKLTREIRKYT